MAIGVHQGVAAIHAAALAAAALAGCSEKPQLLVPQGEQAIEAQIRGAQLRERTRNQSESDRMSY